MEIGLANEETGTSYFNLVEKINGSSKKPMGNEAEKTFFQWFTQNFSSEDGQFNFYNNKSYFGYLLNDRDGKYVAETNRRYVESMKKSLGKNFFVNGEAAKQYVDYLELQESRKNARQATWIAIAAIVLALVTSGYQIYQGLNSPKPPYDVTIIEDKTRTKELERKVDELEERLYEAETLIAVYEDSVQ